MKDVAAMGTSSAAPSDETDTRIPIIEQLRGTRRSSTVGKLPLQGCMLSKVVALGCLTLLLCGECASAQTGLPTVTSIVEALRARDYAKALSLAQELVHARPGDPRALTLEGMALSGMGRTDESLKAFDQALRINLEFVPALEAAAQTAYKAGRPEASNYLETLIRLNPHEQTAHAMLGALAYKRKDCESAVAHFEESLRIINNDAVGLSEFGVCLAQTHQTRNALAAFERLCELRPEDSLARYDLAAVQYQAHLNEEAIETLRPLVKRPMPSVEALNLVAAAYEANRQTPLAVAALQQGIKLAPRDINNYLDLATISLDHGSFQVGVDILNAAIQATPGSAALYLERGVLLVQMLKYDQAASDFEMASKLSPQQNISALALGISLFQHNEPSQSLQLVRTRLQKSPNDPLLNYLLAEILLRKGIQPHTPEFQEALSAARRSVQDKPDFALAHDVLSELYLRADVTGEAIAESRRALKNDPNDQSAIYHLIVALRKTGNVAEVPDLVQRLAQVTGDARKQEAERNRYKLVEDEADKSANTVRH
jgi:tetratricopeptide (TPR) repeat protein